MSELIAAVHAPSGRWGSLFRHLATIFYTNNTPLKKKGWKTEQSRAQGELRYCTFNIHCISRAPLSPRLWWWLTQAENAFLPCEGQYEHTERLVQISHRTMWIELSIGIWSNEIQSWMDLVETLLSKKCRETYYQLSIILLFSRTRKKQYCNCLECDANKFVKSSEWYRFFARKVKTESTLKYRQNYKLLLITFDAFFS